MNRILITPQRLQTLVEGNRYLLTITEAFPKDAGTYTAVARNVAGEASTACNLAVKVIACASKSITRLTLTLNCTGSDTE